MYKIIACDLDETLLSDDRTISKENIEAIQKAKRVRCEVCTSNRKRV